MCGICGELRLDGQLPELKYLNSMMAKLEKRGPDHAGSFSDGALAFGHRRLAIIDLSYKSSQPMVDIESGLALVFNGTIYNHPELRAELKARGHHFFSEGDTEVILKAYAEWGEDAPKHLLGMFAFAIWDMRKKVLFIARDRMGIKPLYYATAGKSFRFASNTQALLTTSGIDTSLDPLALHNLFSLHAVVPAPRTVLNGIRKLQPAHSLTIHMDGRQELKRYWNLVARRPSEPRSEQEWIDAVHESLKTAVHRRNNIADVPVGVLLSGGLDSSLLVGLLAEIGIQDIRTFTIGFDDQPEEKGSEYEYSDAVVERFRPTHHKFHIPNEQTLLRLPEAVANMAEPMFGQDAIGFYLLSEQVSKHVKVVQSGQGADEVFGGYFWYPQAHASTHPDKLQRLAPYYFDRDHREMAEMLQTPFQTRDYTGELVRELLESPDAEETLDAVLRADVTTFIADDPVKRVDNMTMAWGLEARVPFLDHELVELAAQMPTELKLRDGGKYVLKQIARGLVPDSVIDRPKGYFPVPALKFVRGEFLEMMRDLLDSQTCRERGLYQRSYIDKVIANPEAHLTRIQGSKLWHMAALEMWLQSVKV
ncbi:MAG TPA: N-acetylglutaminylglutamine amidotransferase [Candidatus Thiothrix moscowensis]|uniref:N-acetylglutaminylglutamine amidotransferase n=1 Tax=unclassified Thiothrix TaxID=2636184 RepID=UPI0025FD15BF|nr:MULTISPECIES: N-acetylglutaminylglutamine amidotransferase [unclassified Thiothrix]HRJ54433.1 N-acetylglutaminylglutamine amidotransferase [Candidatus Thiothrix moscowensis]HRJ94703.1 N-acetylglutaminylglutamine amidotransferase [Candidatus Thiothrix moscowensis]